MVVEFNDGRIVQAEVAKLRNLYTEHVLSDELLALWNSGLGSVSHIIGAGQDPVAERPRVDSRIVEFLAKHLMIVDSSPTLGRIFAFRTCTDALLTMLLIGMPPQAFVLNKTKPREENKQRLLNVLAFCNHADAMQLLKRTAVSFQMTGGVEALVSTNHKPGTVPPIVRLRKGEADAIIKDRLQRIIRSIAASDDPLLAVAPAVNTLMAVSMELTVRMKQFQGYPAIRCRMSKRYFPGCAAAGNVHTFLVTDEKQLDVGVGLQLHRYAWGVDGTESAAAQWLLSPAAQEIFDQLA